MRGTGLVEAEVRKLSERQRRELAAWTLGKMGGDEIAPFLPNAIRWLSLEQRLALAGDVTLDAAFEELERRKVRRGGMHPVREIWVPAHVYFTEAYGHLRPTKGPRIPFDFWDTRPGYVGQFEVLWEIREHLRQIWLKARQLGMTWLALHDAFQLLAFDPNAEAARILALSKHGGDASKLIARARDIREQLPPYLRPDEASDTKRSLSRFGIVGRGEMLSLAGTPEAARQETAALALMDEAAFIRNRQAGPTWTAVQPTLGFEEVLDVEADEPEDEWSDVELELAIEEVGRAIVLSTGNGPEDVEGDGQAFAKLVSKAQAGAGGLHFVFLPASTDPKRRSQAWRDRARESFLEEEAFEAEHPETVEQALQGQPGKKLYPLAAVNAAAKLGAAFDALLERDELPPPAAVPPHGVRGSIAAIDWGEQTHGLILYPLERGGFYYVREVAQSHENPEDLVEPLLGIPRELELEGGVPQANFDAAGVQSMRTFAATARRGKWRRLRTHAIPFGDYKREAITYQRRLYRRAKAVVDAAEELGVDLVDLLLEGWPADAELEPELVDGERVERKLPALTGLAAVSPTGCPIFLRQTRGLEFRDDDAGKVEKGKDHGPDAGLAGIAETARAFRNARRQDLEPAAA